MYQRAAAPMEITHPALQTRDEVRLNSCTATAARLPLRCLQTGKRPPPGGAAQHLPGSQDTHKEYSIQPLLRRRAPICRRAVPSRSVCHQNLLSTHPPQGTTPT
mmetsp:Transcript_39675/g.98904  ORF Transcript_39675/g.98904 Transcript_39675/m.98904 type:complete len:104 (+) Transcript_39675:139-450(+)